MTSSHLKSIKTLGEGFDLFALLFSDCFCIGFWMLHKHFSQLYTL